MINQWPLGSDGDLSATSKSTSESTSELPPGNTGVRRRRRLNPRHRAVVLRHRFLVDSCIRSSALSMQHGRSRWRLSRRGLRMGGDRKTADRCWEIVATSGDACVGATQGRLGYQALRLGGRWAYRGIRSKREGGIITDPQTGAVYLPALAVSRPGRAEAAFACARSTISVFSERTRRPFASTSRSLRSARRSMTARISRPLAHPTRVIAK